MGSAHWRSSITNTTGRSAASRSSSARTAQRSLLGRGLPAGDPDRLPDALGDRDRVAIIAGQRGELAAGRLRGVGLAQVRRVDQRLGERVERDPLAVRQAATAQDRRSVTELVDERRHEPRLADPPDAEHREELARLIRHRAVEHVTQERQLAFPADDRRVEVSCEPGRTGRHLDQAGRRAPDRPCPSWHRSAIGSATTASRTSENVRSPSRISPGAAACSSRAATFTASPVTIFWSPAAGHHVAGVHADPAGERHPVVAVELRVQRVERRAHLDRGADRAQRVVLVDLRHAEDGHDGVADVLLDGAAVVFDRRRASRRSTAP